MAETTCRECGEVFDVCEEMENVDYVETTADTRCIACWLDVEDRKVEG